MPIVIPSRNIFDIDNNKVINNKIGILSIPVFDTDLKEETFSTTFSTTAFVLSKEYIERTANVKKITFNIKDYIQFFEFSEILDKNGFVIMQKSLVPLEKFGNVPEKITIENPVIGETYNVYFYDFIYLDGSGSTTTLQFQLTDNLRGIVSILSDFDYPMTGRKGFYFNSFNVEVTVEAAKKPTEQISKTYYSTNREKTIFEYEGNHLIQTTSSSEEDVGIDEYISNYILNDFKNGKETAIIRCSIADYFLDTGEKEIDINSNKISFDIGDEVIPMSIGRYGRDLPMSRYDDGSPKKFRVCGIKFIYDGAVWQELSLQEITKEV